MKVFLVGEQFAAARTLDALFADDAVAVVGVACDESSGSQEVARKAHDKGISVLSSRTLNERSALEQVRGLRPDLALNVNSLTLFGEALLTLFPRGAVNFHPGPLPAYAGLHVHQWAIINGESGHGVTYHRMTARIDAGEVLLRAPVSIAASDTGLKLFMKCLQAGTALVRPLVRGIVDGSLVGETQDLSRRKYFGGGLREWWIRFEEPSAHVVNVVRALDYRPFESPLGTPRVRLWGREFTVRDARIADAPARTATGEIAGWTPMHDPIFMCGDGTAVTFRVFDANRAIPWADVVPEDALSRSGA